MEVILNLILFVYLHFWLIFINLLNCSQTHKQSNTTAKNIVWTGHDNKTQQCSFNSHKL